MATSISGNNTSARIPPDAVDRLRQRLGLPAPYLNRPWYSEATLDSIRHCAFARGDDNPLFTDEEYGLQSCWGSIIGPPGFDRLIAQRYPYALSEEQQRLMKGDPLAGISAYMSGTELEFYAPVVPGDRLQALSTLTAVQEKQSAYADHTVLTWNGTVYLKQDGTPVGLRNFVFVHAERDTAAKKGKYAEIQRTVYDDDMLAEIDAAYEAEHVQGATPRYWEDVAVGEELPRMVRGPLLVADMIVTHMAHGPGFYGGLNNTKIAYKNRKRVPKFYSRNPFGAWDSAQRCHWDDDWARQVGQPYAYDYGYMRDEWAATMLTNWGGDNSWLWKYRSSIRRFNYIGDTQWFTGRVVDKQVVDGLPVASLEVAGTNQRGEATITVHAEVILPRRGQPRVPLPPAPQADSPMEVLEAIIRC